MRTLLTRVHSTWSTWSIMASLVVAASFGAEAASASCVGFEELAVVPFADQSVPLNAELRVLGFFSQRDIELTFPDGVTRTTAIVNDAIGPHLDIERPLAVGTYSLVRAEGERTTSFTVSDEVDAVAPNAPTVTATRATQTTPPDLLGLGDDCVDAGFVDIVTLTVDDVSAGDLVMVNGVVAVASTAESVRFAQREERGGDVAYDVTVRDFAGNESAPTRVEVWSGCPGGCSSTGALPLFWGSLVLLRHRRCRARRIPGAAA